MSKTTLKKFLYNFLFLISLISFSSAEGSINGRTIRVPEDYSTIQAGIDAAQDGDTVLVNDGTYRESINFNGKAITVKSVNGFAVTTIDPNFWDPTVLFKSGETSNSVIEGFTITRGGFTLNGWGGIYCDNRSSPVIRKNRIVFNDGGIRCQNSSNPLIENNIITQNDGYGIVCALSSSPEIRQNIIFGNDFGGIDIYSGAAPQIIENIISGNDGSDAITVYGSPAEMLIQNNTIIANTWGILLYDNSLGSIKNNIIRGNGAAGIYCISGSSPEIDYNNVLDNERDYGNCSPGPHDISRDPLFEEYTATVSPGEDSAIQQAIEAIPYHLGTGSPCIGTGENGVNIGAYPQQNSYGSPGEFLINVKAGTYYESIVLPSYVKLVGEGKESTIIDATGQERVVSINGLSYALLQGFTIQNAWMAGINIGRAAGPEIKENMIRENGKGVNGDGNATITGNTIIANRGDAISLDSASHNIFNNVITANGGRGISVGRFSYAFISNNIISENALEGVWTYDASSADIKNNLISKNKASGIQIGWHGWGNAVNNVIISNAGDGIYAYGDSWAWSAANNIIAQNAGYGIKNDDPDLQYVYTDYNDVWSNAVGGYGGYAQPGANDISADPLFVRPDVGHYSLQIDSPAIDAGDPNILDSDGTRSNMGAYGGPEAKIVNVTLVPEGTKIQPRGRLSYSELLSNNFDETYEVDTETELISSKGISYPALGPTTLTLSPYQTVEQEPTFKLPPEAGQGAYTYKEEVSTQEAGIIDESSFDLNVGYFPTIMQMKRE